MHKLFLDTNVFLDWLFERAPNAEAAATIIELGQEGQLELLCSSSTITNLIYFTQKQIKERNRIRTLIKDLVTLVEVIPTNSRHIYQAMDNDFSDLEDAIQYETAAANPKVFAIITQNKKNFKKSKIKVLTPQEYLKNYGY